MTRRLPRQAGFTLLELLVAIGVFAVFSLMAYGGLGEVLNTQAAVEASAEQTRDLQMALFRLEQDIEQARQRPISDQFGDPVPAFHLAQDYVLGFTRGGRLNPMGRPIASLQRVAYLVRDDKLIRRSQPVLDLAQDTQSLETELLDGVVDIRWRFLDDSNEWQTEWPALSASTGATSIDARPPKAVELRLETKRWGELRMLYRIATGDVQPVYVPQQGQPGEPATPPGTAGEDLT